ncbi:ribokinase [Thermanaerovibrio acidaminovorans]
MMSSFIKEVIPMARITVVGSLNLDMVMRAERLPMRGETLTGGVFSTAEGGKGGNQAVACARMGASVRMVGKVGNDPFGDRLVESLLREGIHAMVGRSGGHTGVAQVTVFGDDNAIIVAPGANLDLKPWDLQEDHFKDATSAVFQLEIPVDTVSRGLRMARDMGCLTFLNPSPLKPLPDEVIGLVDYLVLNQVELTQLGGTDDPDLSMGRLLGLGVKGVVLTMGSRGARFLSVESSGSVEASRVEVVDSTGAGDAFMGAFAVMISEGHSMEEAVRFGVTAGSLACLKAGAQPSMPTREEVEGAMGRL